MLEEKLDLAWKEKYELGNEDIDLQHHYFLNLISRIAYEIKNGNDEEYIRALVEELKVYAIFHFKSEEAMMIHSKYPDYEDHKMQHVHLIEKMGIEGYKLLNYKSSDEAEHFIAFLVDWFLHHTRNVDKNFVDYLDEHK